jgi:hypothetical protein
MKGFIEYIQNGPVIGGQEIPDQGMNDPATIEDLRNDLKRIQFKLNHALSKRKMTLNQAKLLISIFMQDIIGNSNLSNTAALQAAKQGINTNTEMNSPPLQPQAQG